MATLVQFNPSTLKVSYNSPKVQMAVTDDCCCFMNPTPAAWSAVVTYDKSAMVTHGGTLYFSNENANLNNTPPHAKWTAYTACGNADWDLFPQFAGPGNTPKYYLVTSRILGHYNLGTSIIWDYTLDLLHILYRPDPTGVPCFWQKQALLGGQIEYSYEDVTGICTGIALPTFAVVSLNLLTFGNYEYRFNMELGASCDVTISCTNKRLALADCNTRRFICPNADVILFDACTLKGTDSFFTDCVDTGTPTLYESQDEVHSWRPYDCNFTMWDSTTDYAVNDCVFWKGKFFICILAHSNQEPPNVTYWTDVS